MKAHLAAALDDAAAQRLDHGGEPVASQMRPVIVHDRRLPFRRREELEHAPHLGPRAAAGELAVAERPRAALAEEVVALGIESSALVEALDVADAVADRRAALEHERLITKFCEKVCRHE